MRSGHLWQLGKDKVHADKIRMSGQVPGGWTCCKKAWPGEAYGARTLSQGVQDRKLAMMRRPVAWLFSGWNWVPTMLSRPTTAVTGSP